MLGDRRHQGCDKPSRAGRGDIKRHQRPLHIVLVCEATAGGVGKHVLDLVESLPSLGFDVLAVHSTRGAGRSSRSASRIRSAS